MVFTLVYTEPSLGKTFCYPDSLQCGDSAGVFGTDVGRAEVTGAAVRPVGVSDIGVPIMCGETYKYA